MLPLLLLMLSPLMLMLLPLLVGVTPLPLMMLPITLPLLISPYLSSLPSIAPIHTRSRPPLPPMHRSSPVYAPRAQEFPFGTPVKQEPIKLKDKDNLLAAPNFAQHGANNNVPLFAQPAFDFAPPFTY
ncbi:hypothetical protein FRC08_013079 [Ceratobasidium sp. 394]|nr:hypothetical protein FRC08_013079 [Ceratobasidium sp. 394]